jgi:arylsulfatase
VTTLPDILQDAGYFIFMSAKWHPGLTAHRFHSKRGFGKWFVLLPGCANKYSSDYFTDRFIGYSDNWK